MANAQAAPPDYGFNFITIGDAGNPAYDGPDERGWVTGRGSVEYEYRIARTEVTTEQYVEYMNSRRIAGYPVGFVDGPRHLGADFDFATGFWVTRPGQEMLPVVGVTWRDAAMFCNWLHNGKVARLDKILRGAYDATSFGQNGMMFTDQTAHNPDAKYWIPSLDEWIKAAHYDPDKLGPGQGGWWQYNDSSDTQPVPGLPGVGETSAGLEVSDAEAYAIPLGSYPQTQTPWGLLDTSGGGAEWTEEWIPTNGDPSSRERRLFQGNAAGLNTWYPNDPDLAFNTLDGIYWIGSDEPDRNNGDFTLRLASSIPAPWTGGIFIVGLTTVAVRRNRK